MLTETSFAYLIPAIYALEKQQSPIDISFVLVTGASLMYHAHQKLEIDYKKSCCKTFHKCDEICAYSSVVLVSYLFIKNGIFKSLWGGYIILLVVMALYLSSQNEFYEIYHSVWHLLTALAAFLIIYFSHLGMPTKA